MRGRAALRELALAEIDLLPVEAVSVFNLTVEGSHNYFAEGVLVHNKRDDDERGR